MAEVVQSSVNGLLFKVGDSQDLAQKMEMIIKEPDLIEKLKKNMNLITPMEKHAVDIREHYRTIIDQNQSKPI